jgi:hypothetical protein
LPSRLERARALLAEPGDLTIDDIEDFIALSSAREDSDCARQRAREETDARKEKLCPWPKHRLPAAMNRFAELRRARLRIALGLYDGQ